jgi:hypothetical protein
VPGSNRETAASRGRRFSLAFERSQDLRLSSGHAGLWRDFPPAVFLRKSRVHAPISSAARRGWSSASTSETERTYGSRSSETLRRRFRSRLSYGFYGLRQEISGHGCDILNYHGLRRPAAKNNIWCFLQALRCSSAPSPRCPALRNGWASIRIGPRSSRAVSIRTAKIRQAGVRLRLPARVHPRGAYLLQSLKSLSEIENTASALISMSRT